MLFDNGKTKVTNTVAQFPNDTVFVKDIQCLKTDSVQLSLPDYAATGTRGTVMIVVTMGLAWLIIGGRSWTFFRLVVAAAVVAMGFWFVFRMSPKKQNVWHERLVVSGPWGEKQVLVVQSSMSVDEQRHWQKQYGLDGLKEREKLMQSQVQELTRIKEAIGEAMAVRMT